MQQLYITGGQQRAPRPLLADSDSWYEYRQGLILELTPETGAVRRCVAYTSPPAACAPHDPQVLFKSASRVGNRLYASTQTEVLIYALPEFQQVGYISLPCFNDVHHVHPTAWGTLLVANSGLDMVLELTPTGTILREWATLGGNPWEHFSRQIDYRKGISTKPHRSHPNYVFTVGEQVWATRFQQRDALCLTEPELRIALSDERVHDGVLYNRRLYFTSVDGRIVVANPTTLAIEAQFDLAAMHEPDALLGWCRGLLIDGDCAWVGFSTIRPTRFRENIGWVARGFRTVLPTRVACYNLRREVCVASFDMQAHGLDAVFSILPAGDNSIMHKG